MRQATTLVLNRSLAFAKPLILRPPNTLITVRGLLILIIIGYLFAGPVTNEADIVAAVISYSLLAVVLGCLVITLINGLSIRRNFSVQIFPPSASSGSDHLTELYAQAPLPFVMRTSPVRIAPLFVLRITLEFENEGIELPTQQLTGFSAQERLIQQDIIFPHRGKWKIGRIGVSLGDQFGFSSFNWDISSESAHKIFSVRPPPQEYRSLPILSSCQRSGDMVIDTHERRGELFDLKPYHPSDGMKKILWKIYAKSGQLISRHPEASMTPEGQVVAFVLASKDDDHVCSTAISYLHILQNLEIEIFFSCEGTTGPIVRDALSSEERLIDSVWQAIITTPVETKSDLERLINQTKQQLNDGRIDKVLIFCSVERLSSSTQLNLYLELGGSLERHNITPVFFLIPLQGTSNQNKSHPSVSTLPEQVRHSLSKWFFQRQSTPTTAITYYSSFLTACAQRRWPVIM